MPCASDRATSGRTGRFLKKKIVHSQKIVFSKKMPRKYRKRRRKKSYKTRKRRFRRKMGVPFGLPSQTRLVSLRFCYRGSILDVGPQMRHISVRANSARNPTAYFGTEPLNGMQPLLFDQMAKLYKKVMVVGSKIQFYVTPAHQSGGNIGQASQIIAGVYLSKQPDQSFESVEDYISAKRGSYKTLSFQRNQTRLTSTYSMKKFFNVTDVKDNQTDFAENTQQDDGQPNRLAHFVLYAQNINLLDSRVTDLPFMYTLDLTCVFSTPRDIQDVTG